MTAGATGPVPDDVIDAAAEAYHNAWRRSDWSVAAETTKETYRTTMAAALSVPAVAAVFARDTQAREIVAESELGKNADLNHSLTLAKLRRLYAEDGAR